MKAADVKRGDVLAYQRWRNSPLIPVKVLDVGYLPIYSTRAYLLNGQRVDVYAAPVEKGRTGKGVVGQNVETGAVDFYEYRFLLGDHATVATERAREKQAADEAKARRAAERREMLEHLTLLAGPLPEDFVAPWALENWLKGEDPYVESVGKVVNVALWAARSTQVKAAIRPGVS